MKTDSGTYCFHQSFFYLYRCFNSNFPLFRRKCICFAKHRRIPIVIIHVTIITLFGVCQVMSLWNENRFAAVRTITENYWRSFFAFFFKCQVILCDLLYFKERQLQNRDVWQIPMYCRTMDIISVHATCGQNFRKL